MRKRRCRIPKNTTRKTPIKALICRAKIDDTDNNAMSNERRQATVVSTRLHVSMDYRRFPLRTSAGLPAARGDLLNAHSFAQSFERISALRPTKITRSSRRRTLIHDHICIADSFLVFAKLSSLRQNKRVSRSWRFNAGEMWLVLVTVVVVAVLLLAYIYITYDSINGKNTSPPPRKHCQTTYSPSCPGLPVNRRPSSAGHSSLFS